MASQLYKFNQFKFILSFLISIQPLVRSFPLSIFMWNISSHSSLLSSHHFHHPHCISFHVHNSLIYFLRIIYFFIFSISFCTYMKTLLKFPSKYHILIDTHIIYSWILGLYFASNGPWFILHPFSTLLRTTHLIKQSGYLKYISIIDISTMYFITRDKDIILSK